MSDISVSGMVAEVTPRVRTGASAGLNLWKIGGAGRSWGSRFPAAFIFASTSCSALSRLTSRENSRVITDAPAELVDSIWVRPGICPNWRSNGAVTAVAMTSGLAPGKKVCTWMVG